MTYSRKEAGTLGWFANQAMQEKVFKIRCETYYQNPNKCKICLKILIYEKRKYIFCSRKCAAICNSKLRSRLPIICKMCKIAFIRQRGSECKICTKCRPDKLKRFETLLGDPSRRRRLLKERGNKCEVCGFEKWQNKDIPLVLDHRDGDHLNNTKLNLRLICPNCDALTDTYKGRNKGKGRYSRRLRYQQNKSY